jgi:nonribosomal peptide synthetase protein BlmVI
MAARMRGLSPLDLRVAPEPASESGVERAVLRQWLPAPTAARLRGCDAVSLLAAVWGVCLSRFSAGGPVAIGMPMLGRTEAGHAELPGVCTNTVPVLVDGHPDGELPALIRSVRSQLLDALDHPLYPLSRAVAASAPARLPGRMPLVESFFTYHETPDKSVDGLLRALAGAAAAEVTCGQLSLRSVPVRRLSCRCDLDLVVTPADGGFAVELSYRSSRLGARAAGSILSTFMAMVERATCGQARRVADLYVLSRDDEAGLRDFGVGWTAAAAGGFWQLLARNAQPTAAAIEAPDLRLDYGQLGGHVDAVARYLMRRYGAQSGQGGGPVPGQGTDRGRED